VFQDAEANEELCAQLKRFLCALPVCGAPLDSLDMSIHSLCKEPAHQDAVLTALWDGVVHPRPVVRSAAASLFVATVGSLSEALVAARVAPALVTLSSDPDLWGTTHYVEINNNCTRCWSGWLVVLWVNVKLLLCLSKTLWEGMESPHTFKLDMPWRVMAIHLTSRKSTCSGVEKSLCANCQISLQPVTLVSCLNPTKHWGPIPFFTGVVHLFLSLTCKCFGLQICENCNSSSIWNFDHQHNDERSELIMPGPSVYCWVNTL
jgi:hypothetical protein